LTILAAAKSEGVKVLISDPMDYRLEIAKKMGADKTVNNGRMDLVKEVMDWTDGIGAAVVV